MKSISVFHATIIPTILSCLFWSNAFSAESMSVKARSAPHSGIESLQTFCTMKADAQASKDIYAGFPELTGMIESALDRNFIGKGFSKAQPNNCDIRMHYAVSITEQRQLGGGKNPQSSDMGLGDVVKATVIDKKGRLRMGMLTLNVYDKSGDRKIWVGNAKNTEGVYIDLNKPAKPDIQGVRQRVNVAVNALFLRFPARKQ